MWFLKKTAILFVALSSFGCVPKAVLDTADLASESVDQIRKEIEVYKKALEVDAKRRIEILARQKESIAEAEASLDVQLVV